MTMFTSFLVTTFKSGLKMQNSYVAQYVHFENSFKKTVNKSF